MEEINKLRIKDKGREGDCKKAKESRGKNIKREGKRKWRGGRGGGVKGNADILEIGRKGCVR